jgi:parallel beta-helix repeat protein
MSARTLLFVGAMCPGLVLGHGCATTATVDAQRSDGAFHVSPSGSDAYPGTEARPFRTLRKGVSVLSPGATLYVKSGTYAESLNNVIPGGRSWSEPVTVAAYPGHKVILKPPVGSGFALHFQGASQAYIVISGLTVDASNVTYGAVKITRGSPGDAAHHIRLIDSEIRDAPENGILTTGSAHSNEFIRLTVHSNGGVLKGRIQGYGFYLATDNNLVEECDIYSNAKGGIQIYWRDGPVHGNVIRGSRVTGNGSGVILTRGSRHLAYNNLIHGNERFGLKVDYGAKDARVLNNTIYGNGLYGIYIGERSSGAVLRDNTVHSNGKNIRDLGRGTILGKTVE